MSSIVASLCLSCEQKIDCAIEGQLTVSFITEALHDLMTNLSILFQAKSLLLYSLREAKVRERRRDDMKSRRV